MAKLTRCAPELQDLQIWHRYEPQLRELYIVQNQTLKRVKKSMEELHGWPVFKLATYEVVLREELRLVKNLTKRDWHAIQRHMEKRLRVSKRSEVVLHGQVVGQRRIAKAIGRYCQSVDIDRARTPILRDGLRIRTPPLLSPQIIVPGGMAYTQIESMAQPSNNIANTLPPTQPEGAFTILPRSSGRPLSIEAIFEIRANAPFNKFASKLQELWSSAIIPDQGGVSSVGSLPQLVKGAHTPHRFPQTDRATIQDQVIGTSDGSSQNNLGKPTSFLNTNGDVGMLMKACYIYSNNFDDIEVQRRFLDWVGLIAEKELLRAFFSLKLPTVIAVWENSLKDSYEFKHGKAFNILIEIGLAVDNGRLIQSRHAMYFALAIDLGYSKAMDSVSRLMKAGVSQNARFDQCYLSRTIYVPNQFLHGGDHYWRCCALKQAAKNRDHALLHLLITAGNCRCGKFDAMSTPSLQCVEVMINGRMWVDSLPAASRTLAFTMESLGWNNCGKPELLVDRVFFTDEGADRSIYKAVASKSQWAQKSVTVSGIFMAAERGTNVLQQYLGFAHIPQSKMNEALLQIALSEAAARENIAVLVCLLEFGVDPHVNTLGIRLPEDEHLQWNPLARAATQCNAGALRVLLNQGLDIRGYQLFQWVMQHPIEPGSDLSQHEKRRSLTIQLLLDAGAHIDIPPDSLMLAAILPITPYKKNIVHLRPHHRRQYLDHIANFKPDYALWGKLQQHGISFDCGVDGCNTLQTLLRKGCNLCTVSYLIHNGVQVHSFPTKNEHLSSVGDTTMLHDALLIPHVDRSKIVEILIENGADVFATTSTGISVLEASLTSYDRFPGPEHTRQESLDIFWALSRLMGPRHVSLVDFKHRSLLSYLIELGESDETICAGLDMFGDINSYRVSQGMSLLMQAIERRRITLVMKLLERGCDVNLRIDSLPPEQQHGRSQSNNALQIACRYDKDESQDSSILQLLLQKGAEANDPPNMYGMTALQYAVAKGDLRIVTLLLEHGADINAKPGIRFWDPDFSKLELTNRSQAVDVAVCYRHLDMVHLLVEAGGLSGIPGITGLDGAMLAANEDGSTGILEYLQQHTGHQLSEILCQANAAPASPASVTSTSDMSSECSDGERSCHCQPLDIDWDASGIGEESHGPVEEVSAEQEPSTAPRDLTLPLRSPVYTGTLAPPGAAPGEAIMEAAPDAELSGQTPSGADLTVDTPAGRASDTLYPQDSMNRVAAGDADPDGSTEFQGSLEQIMAKDREWDPSTQNGFGEGECMTPITRGILEWIQETDFDYNSS
ncbi:ankyrin repeat-containing domain protein [Apiospora saccharicola]